MNLRLLMLLAPVALLTAVRSDAAQFEIEKDDDGYVVKLDGELFTRYITRSGNKPVLWPIVGPTGERVTREYPVADALPAEREDHPHHRGLWFTHGDVNGVSYWHEGKGTGEIKHQKFTKVEAGEQATLTAINDWIDPEGNKVCEDERTLTFHADGDRRWIDYSVTVRAADEPVTFGDTKEGSFGIRLAGTMKVDSEPGGTIVNAEGQKDGAAWGKQAPWVDYYGPVEGETVGVTIMNHPSSFRYPTYWHVRTYGLFAANPFGLHDFKRDSDIDAGHTLQPDESFTLRYRVLLHKGSTEEANIARAFEQYAETSVASE